MFWTIIISLFALFASLIVNSAQNVLISLPISVRASSGGVELQTLKVNHRDSLVAKVEAFCRQHRISDIETYNNIFSYTLDSIRQGNPKLIAMEITGSFIPPYLQPMKNLTFFFKPYGSFRYIQYTYIFVSLQHPSIVFQLFVSYVSFTVLLTLTSQILCNIVFMRAI